MHQIKQLGFLSLVVLFIFLNSLHLQAAPLAQEVLDKTVIVIDPGHGGENEGTTENGVLEKSMNMITALAMYEELCLYDDIEVHMTHTEDIDMSLKERAEFAAGVDADFLFSIHYNASVDHDLFGSEVWISSQTPFHAYGYQFGYVHMQEMQDMGLFLRGIKTKLNSKDLDYYGIIRESVALNVPAVIIEHCHVDEERDYPYCDSEEDLIAFGKADALAVAKYFGLKSKALGVDYSEELSLLPEVNEKKKVQSTLKDETAPDVCMVTLLTKEEDTGIVTLQVSAADYDSPLIYYDYSIDSGHTYSALQPWPQSNALEGTYQDTFQLELQIPSGMQPNIIVRAYNLFDAFTASEKLPIMHIFRYGEQYEKKPVVNEVTTKEPEKDNLPGTTTFFPANSTSQTEDDTPKEITFWDFLKISLIFVIIIFFIILISQVISYHKRKKRRIQRIKEAGKRNNQRR